MAWIAYCFGWSRETVMRLSSRERRIWIKQIEKIFKQLAEAFPGGRF